MRKIPLKDDSLRQCVMQAKRAHSRPTVSDSSRSQRKRQRTLFDFFTKLNVQRTMSCFKKEGVECNEQLRSNESCQDAKFENTNCREIEVSNCSEHAAELRINDESDCVLYDAPSKSASPSPKLFTDLWNSRSHVKMPCSQFNQVILVKTVDGKRTQVRLQKWEVITNHLTSDHIKSSSNLVTVIKAYNPIMVDDDFVVLYCFIDECLDYSERRTFFDSLLPSMVKLALRLPSLVTQSVPILKQKENKTLHLHQEQIGCLLANAFFCTFPKRSQYKLLPEINFRSLFSNATGKTLVTKTEKLKCILNYFRRIVNETPKGVVSFERRFFSRVMLPDWSSSEKPLRRLQVFSEGLIENEGKGMLQVDFANKLVGGGVLNSGCVQEEIRFVINPELIVARLFTEELMDNEVLFVTGCEQFNQYSGYADKFRFKSNFVDKTPMDSLNRRCTQIVALDALYFSFADREKQYRRDCIDRELNKAYTAFVENGEGNKTAIATGHWGCGAFNGDPQLKAMLQLLAASESERDVVYFTFYDDDFKSRIDELYDVLQLNQHTVGSLYSKICNFWKIRESNVNAELLYFIACDT